MDNNELLFQVVIENGLGEFNVKYEINPEDGHIYVDRFLNTTLAIPFNYGFIPNSQGGDGDPLDACVLCSFPLLARSIIQCRAIGVLSMSDEKGVDDKIIAVPSDSITDSYDNIREISDLSPHLTKKIQHFFQHYKDLDADKFVNVGKFLSAQMAREIIQRSSFE
jgi:inorganic pyrophosphatase